MQVEIPKKEAYLPIGNRNLMKDYYYKQDAPASASVALGSHYHCNDKVSI